MDWQKRFDHLEDAMTHLISQLREVEFVPSANLRREVANLKYRLSEALVAMEKYSDEIPTGKTGVQNPYNPEFDGA